MTSLMNTYTLFNLQKILNLIAIFKCSPICAYYYEPLQSLVVRPSGKETASLIFLHGASTDGPSMCQELLTIYAKKGFFLPHMTYIFPTSENRTVNGNFRRSWFDRRMLTLDSVELFDTIDPPCHAIHRIVKNEIIRGIHPKRIFVGGYSMGGALALLYAYRYLLQNDPDLKIGGIIALSAFLNSQSEAYSTMDEASDKDFAALFHGHGRHDDVVNLAWALDTVKKLKFRGVKVDLQVFDEQDHDLGQQELEEVKIWIEQKLN